MRVKWLRGALRNLHQAVGYYRLDYALPGAKLEGLARGGLRGGLGPGP